VATKGSRVQRWSAEVRGASEEEKWPSGSRLKRIVPGRRTGSWGRQMRRLRTTFLGTVEMSMPSIVIVPLVSSMRRRREERSVLFPLVAC
jgi:hypothetical protein